MTDLQRPLFVGEDLGRAPVPDGDRLVLTGASGRTLARLSGMSLIAWLVRTERVNVVDRPSQWQNPRRLLEALDRIVPMMEGRRTVLLGAKVRDWYGLDGSYPWFTWTEADPDLPGWGLVALAPHPSGRNRALNNPLVRDDFARFLRDLYS